MAVLVFTENWDGKFKKSSFELVSYASALAEMMGTRTIALSIGPVDESELVKLGGYGADRIVNVSEDGLKALDSQVYTKIISSVAEKENVPSIIPASTS